jgi:quinol monooxygenase YgiN
MKVFSRLLLAANVAGLLLWSYAFSKQASSDVVVRMAQLDIDPARLADYTRAVKEEMEDAVRLEPGVLAIYAVAEKGNSARLHFFEIYTSEAAYASHRETPHFRKYLAITQPMIRERKLIEATPVQMSAK